MATMTVACIDQEISRHKRALLDLYTQKNSLASISCLSAELLEIIFIQCARDHHDIPFTWPHWINISYVCRHWRNVALNCSTLWSYVFMISPRWTEELLARSRMVSLKLNMDPYDGHNPVKETQMLRILEQAMEHSERIQEFYFGLPDTEEERFFTKLNSSPAPRLQNLRISMTAWSGGGWWCASVPFHGDTPALQSLELLYCPFPWYSFKLSHLTTLALQDVHPRSWQNTVDFLVTLNCMQDLTYLYLDDALASAVDFLSSTTFDAFEKINLPYLSRLLLTAPSSTVTALLACINIPLNTELRLKCDAEWDFSLDDYALLSSILAQRLNMIGNQGSPSSIVRSLVVMPEKEGYITASVSESSESCKHPISISYNDCRHSWVCDIPLHIEFIEEEKETEIHVISDIASSVSWTNLHSLYTSCPFSSALWKNKSGELLNLRRLTLAKVELDMLELASLVSFTPHSYAKNGDECVSWGPNQMFAPALEELVLWHVCFTQSESEMDTYAVWDRSLGNALATRKGTRGRFTMESCLVKYGTHIESRVDMIGRWEDGQFYVVEWQSHAYD